MITPQQSAAGQQVLQSAGVTPKASSGGGSSSWYDAVQAATPQTTVSTPKVAPKPNLGQLDASQVEQGASKIKSSVTGGADKIQHSPTLGGKVAGAAEAGLGAASGAVQSIFAPLTATLQGTGNATGIHPIQAATDAASKTDIGQKLEDWAKAHPEAAKNLGDLVNVGGAALGGEVAPEADLTEGASAVKQGAKNLIETVKSGVEDAQNTKASQSTAKALNDTINAVNPDLSGKKLVSAYKGTVTGSQKVTPASIFREQGLTPSEQTTNLGTRLHTPLELGDGSKLDSVPLTGDHVKNLGTIGKAMGKTEGKIDTALKGDPDMNYNADKPSLQTKLDDLKKNIPGEFAAIKDSKNLFNHVINFAKGIIEKTDDSVEGIRNARTAFDTQARTEYSSAFKGSGIDVSTPAGRAIKATRDAMNEHLYNTAPNGSDIQKMIGREADLFRATDSVAAKAAKGEGKSGIQQAIKNHPHIARYLKYTLGIAGADEIIKHVTGIGL